MVIFMPCSQPEWQKGTHNCLLGTFLKIMSYLIDPEYTFSVTFCSIFACGFRSVMTKGTLLSLVSPRGLRLLAVT